MPDDRILTPHEVVVACLHCDKQVIITTLASISKQMPWFAG